MPRVIA